MQKLRLDTQQIVNDFFADTRLLGIMATVKNYRFCWYINNMLGYNFFRNPAIDIQLKKKNRDYFFPVYQHDVRNSFLHHYLYHNHYDGEYLLPEFKHIDFLWLMKGDYIDDEQCVGIIQVLKSIAEVQLVVELTNEQIRNKQHLIF